ncbi:MAG: NifU N-terminal domain-containing protein [Tepidisphaerales bacterium]
MPYQVTDVQPTPNPNARKFVLDARIAEQPVSFFNAEAASDHPVASKLFAIDGVTSILLLGDFVTVNKRPDAPWTSITAKVRTALGEV